MSIVKDIKLKIIPRKLANIFVAKYHYSHNFVIPSQLHFGAFLDNKLHGVIQYGPPMYKSQLMSLVENTKWDEFLEINRIAFDDILPKNSESRCLAITLKLIKKHIPRIKWIVSFADGTQSGNGIIYRAVGFYLTAIKKNTSIKKDSDGNIFCDAWGEYSRRKSNKINRKNIKILPGFQFRYIYLYDEAAKLTVPIIPYSDIERLTSIDSDAPYSTNKERRVQVPA